MKRITALGLGLAMACLLSVPAYAVPAEVTAPSAILMEKTTSRTPPPSTSPPPSPR